MKKIFVIAAILISFNCYAQSDWMWSHPYPQGNALRDIFIKSPNTICAVGECGTLLSSSNFGTNWSVSHKLLFQKTDFYDFFKFSESIYYAGTSNGMFYKSTNGGLNWNYLYTFQNSYINDIKMVTENVGYVVTANAVMKTINGGLNWNSVFQATNVFSCNFLDENTGFAGSGGMETTIYIHKTTNGGINWSNYPLNASIGRVDFVSFATSNTGFALINNSGLIKTTNQGINWFFISQGFNVSSVFPIDENLIYASRISNEFIISTNGGTNWTSKYFPTFSQRKMVFKDINTGYVLATNNDIYATTNAGTNWIKTSNSNDIGTGANSHIEYSSFINSTSGIVSGRGPALLKTTNAGINWTLLQAPTYSVSGISMVNATTGYLACWYSCGRISKTTNGGENWIITDSLSPNFLKFVRFFNQTTGIVTDEKGNLFRTTNAGLNWSVQQTGLVYSMGGSFILNETTGYITGLATYQNGRLLKTTNAGQNWNTIYSTTGNYISNTYFTNELTGYCTGSNVMKTTNGGYNWTTYTNFPGLYKSGIEVVNNSTIFVTGQGAVYKSTNDGLNWGSLDIPTNNYLNFTKFFDSNNGIVCGDYGIILRTTNGGGLVGVNNIESKVPASYSLGQNYPNPFNPMTNVKFSIVKAGDVKIVVYDIQGRKVQTLVNERLSAGTYEVKFDGSMLTSGVYFYKMVVRIDESSTGDFTETKRMILLK
jgi:photosystem II stability/assembly factor-like uncharacterized protein